MNPTRPNKNGIFPILPDGVHTVALGNGTQHQIIKYQDVYGVLGKGCYEFSHFAHAGYVQQKLGFGSYEGDAANFADFINDQLGVGAERQGWYYEDLCEKEVAT